jgi:hypothetical protein
MKIDEAFDLEDNEEQALREALEASKQAYLTCSPADRPASLKAFKAALYAFSEYTRRHMVSGRGIS